jgi:hypothetical protein
MKSLLVLVLLLYKSEKLFSQGPCLCQSKPFKYKALFIDSIGDTLTNEIIEVVPTGKPWFFQPRVQKGVSYYFSTDTSGYQKINPNFQDDRYKNHLKRNGKIKFVNKETTGYACRNTSYFLHPPRQNQYQMLFYGAYPFMYYSKLSDTIEHYSITMNIPGPVDAVHRYVIFPYVGISPFKDISQLKLWNVNAVTDVTGLSEYFESQHYHDSKMEGLYCPEIGFVKMQHTFENGVKIYFDYIENSLE